jgi:serine/threonine protein kinase
VELEEYKDEEVIATKPLSANDYMNWIIAVVVEGSVTCVPMGMDMATALGKGPAADALAADQSQTVGGGKHKSMKEKFAREQGMFFGSSELGVGVEHVVSTGRTKIAFITLDLFESMAGPDAVLSLNEIVTNPKFRGKALNGKKTKGALDDPKNLELPRNTEFASRDDFVLSMANIQIGNFAILGTFNAKVGSGSTFSAKLVAKTLAQESRMDSRLLQEKEILCGMRKGGPMGLNSACVAQLKDYFQNERVIVMRYSDLYMCDLALAIQQNAIEDENKVYYSACLFSAVAALHDIGVMHRFINPGSVYITSKGVPKLTDMRYTKLMDGQKCFTICGDPLYFAPEIVKQTGYDFGVDLWALGCTVYELYEGKHPIGTPDVEETALFKLITSFEPGILDFSKKSPKKVRVLLLLLFFLSFLFVMSLSLSYPSIASCLPSMPGHDV